LRDSALQIRQPGKDGRSGRRVGQSRLLERPFPDRISCGLPAPWERWAILSQGAVVFQSWLRSKADRGNRSLGRGANRWAVFAVAWLLLVSIAAAQTPVLPKPELPARTANPQQLRGGWYPWDPYQYRDYKRGIPILTGFDVEIERALARIMGVEILLPEIAWEDHLAALAAGTGDIAAGATFSEARSRYAYFSKPYRAETDVLILPRGASGRYPFRTVEQMLDTFAKQKFRLGSLPGSSTQMSASMPSLQIRLTATRSFP
jgi:hypothetical protein